MILNSSGHESNPNCASLFGYPIHYGLHYARQLKGGDDFDNLPHPIIELLKVWKVWSILVSGLSTFNRSWKPISGKALRLGVGNSTWSGEIRE